MRRRGWPRNLLALVVPLMLCLVVLDARGETKEAKDKEVGKAGGKPGETKVEDYVKGIYYGWLLYISDDGRVIEVKPDGKDGPIESFVLDRLTKVREDRKASKRKHLKVGQKVAIRYFGTKRVQVAEVIFIVNGEFKPADYKKSFDKPKK